MISEDQVRMLVETDLGGWSRSDLDRLAERLGWRVDERGSGLAFDTGGAVEASASGRSASQARFGFGDYTRVAVSRRTDPDGFTGLHRAALRAVEGVLGAPVLVGGPDAQAHWRLADRLVQVRGFSARSSSRVTVSVRPRDAAEAQEHSEAEWGDDWSPDLDWSALPGGIGPEALTGKMFHPRRAVTTWKAFESNVRVVFRSLAVDVPLLARHVHTLTWVLEPRTQTDEDHPRFVQGWFAPDECHLEVWGAADVATTSKNGVPGRTVEPGSDESGLQIAELALTAVRAWGLAGPQDLRHRAWSTSKGVVVDDFGLGLDQ